MELSFFPYLIAFIWIGILLMAGTYIRAKVPFLQRMLFPASLLGGIIGFALVNIGWLGVPTTEGWRALDQSPFGMITFHLFAFGFVGIGFLEAPKESNSKVILRGSFWIAFLFTMMFAMQGLIGKGIFAGWEGLFGGSFETVNGYLLGAGFTQGPGQTQAYATIWETSYHTVNAVNTGLAFAAIGFLIAGLVGVPLALYGLKKGWAVSNGNKTLPRCLLRGLMDEGDNPACAFGTTHPANIDTFGFHLGLMAATYGIAYLIALAWAVYAPPILADLGFGLLFFWGMLAAMLVRKFMRFRRINTLLDGETTRRITSTTVDFMICAVFMGIRVSTLQDILIPFILSILVATVLTLIVCLWFGRRSPEYGFERCLALFGYCTGTAASGLLLLRIADPDFETPVAVEIGVMNVCATFIFDPTVTVSMPFAPLEGFPIAWIFLALTVGIPIIMYFLKMIRKPAF